MELLARADQRAAVHHVRGAAQGRRRSRSSTHKTHIKPWFIEQMKELVELEEEILKYKGKPLPDELLAQAKKDGFADRYLAKLLGVAEARDPRAAQGARAWSRRWDAVPVSGVENAAYYYSTYNAPDKVAVSDRHEGHGARRRAQPHRPGHRVRLLLRPRGLRPARRGLRVDHGQLQPGDRLHRLRHLRQALLRAADGRGRAEHLREGEAARASSSSSAARRR